MKQKAAERAPLTKEQSAQSSFREIFNLILLPGFSTAEKVTNVSGRGVGVDVVKTNVTNIGGTVEVSSVGAAMVCRRFSGMLANSDGEKNYAAGLLHDIGFLVNCLLFPGEFSKAADLARQEGMPMDRAELATMGSGIASRAMR